MSEETRIPTEYSNFSNVFSSESMLELLEHTKVNNYFINLLDTKQPSYGLIYSLWPVELEILKIYINANIASSFIKSSKSATCTLIPFIQKKNNSFYLYMDYQGLNSLTIKNHYPLPLIDESLNYLGHAKRFTNLNLTNAYYQIKIRKGDKWKTEFRTWYSYFEY